MDARTKYYIDAVERRVDDIPSINKNASLGLYHLLGTADLLHTHFAPFAQNLGLSIAGWNTLNLLHYAEVGARPMHELSRLLLSTRQNVTQLVDGLEKKRFVERSPSPQDGRVKLVTITKKGRDVVLEWRAHHHESVREVFETLRDPELALLNDYLLRIQARIEELAARAPLPPVVEKSKRPRKKR